MHSALVPIAFIAAPVVAGGLVGLGIRKSVPWYETLPRPSWAPPKQAFAPVWTILYAVMGYAAFLAWRAGAPSSVMTLFAVQLVLNIAWAPLFFSLKKPTLALADIILLLVALIATIRGFWLSSQTAGALLVPYAAWVAYAAALNASIVQALARR